jgi:hypothetical protein
MSRVCRLDESVGGKRSAGLTRSRRTPVRGVRRDWARPWESLASEGLSGADSRGVWPRPRGQNVFSARQLRTSGGAGVFGGGIFGAGLSGRGFSGRGFAFPLVGFSGGLFGGLRGPFRAMHRQGPVKAPSRPDYDRIKTRAMPDRRPGGVFSEEFPKSPATDLRFGGGFVVFRRPRRFFDPA